MLTGSTGENSSSASRRSRVHLVSAAGHGQVALVCIGTSNRTSWQQHMNRVAYTGQQW